MTSDNELRAKIREACMVTVRGVGARLCSISQKQTDAVMQLIAQSNQQAVQEALGLGEQSPWEVTVAGGGNNINIHLTHPKDVAEYGRAFRAIERLAALTDKKESNK